MTGLHAGLESSPEPEEASLEVAGDGGLEVKPVEVALPVLLPPLQLLLLLLLLPPPLLLQPLVVPAHLNGQTKGPGGTRRNGWLRDQWYYFDWVQLNPFRHRPRTAGNRKALHR